MINADNILTSLNIIVLFAVFKIWHLTYQIYNLEKRLKTWRNREID